MLLVKAAIIAVAKKSHRHQSTYKVYYSSILNFNFLSTGKQHTTKKPADSLHKDKPLPLLKLKVQNKGNA